MKRHFSIGLCILLILFTAHVVSAEATPEEVLKQDVNQVLDILRDKSLGKEAKTEKLESIYKTMFNEVELSKRSLGRHWTQLNPSQQKEFVDLFRQILEKAYANKILSYTNEKITVSKGTMLSENRSEVPTTVITSSRQIPITYHLIKENNTWKVYDVIVENVSLVQNYRSQFNDIMSRNSPQQLIETLRKRLEK